MKLDKLLCSKSNDILSSNHFVAFLNLPTVLHSTTYRNFNVTWDIAKVRDIILRLQSDIRCVDLLIRELQITIDRAGSFSAKNFARILRNFCKEITKNLTQAKQEVIDFRDNRIMLIKTYSNMEVNKIIYTMRYTPLDIHFLKKIDSKATLLHVHLKDLKNQIYLCSCHEYQYSTQANIDHSIEIVKNSIEHIMKNTLYALKKKDFNESNGFEIYKANIMSIYDQIADCIGDLVLLLTRNDHLEHDRHRYKQIKKKINKIDEYMYNRAARSRLYGEEISTLTELLTRCDIENEEHKSIIKNIEYLITWRNLGKTLRRKLRQRKIPALL